VTRGNVTPRSDRSADFTRDLAGAAGADLEVACRVQGERESSRVVVPVDRGAQDSRLDVGRHGIQIASRAT
jgi:hypothetical protein